MVTSDPATTAKKAAAPAPAKKAAATPPTVDEKAAAEEAARVEQERKDREAAEKQREKDAKATEGEFDTTDDPDTARDTYGDVITVESGGAIAQPVGPVVTTYTDSHGIDRIAGGFDDGWVPAPIDPDPALVRQNEAAMQRIRDARTESERRQGILGATDKRAESRDEKANKENAKASKAKS